MTEGFEQLQRQLRAAEQRLARDRCRPKGRPVGKLLPALVVVITLSVIAVVLWAAVRSHQHLSGVGPQKPPDRPAQLTGPAGSVRTLPLR